MLSRTVTATATAVASAVAVAGLGSMSAQAATVQVHIYQFVEAHRSVPIVQLSDAQLGEVLDACKFADLIQDQAKAEARRRLREGGMSGFTLKPNSARRAITDGSLPFTLLHEAGFTHEELFSVASLSVSGATKLYTRKKRTAKEAAQALALVLGGCMRINEVEPSIVRL